MSKINNRVKNILMIASLIMASVALFLVSIYFPPSKGYFLQIDTDEDFIKLGLPGNGTLNNPFVIENIDFGIIGKTTTLDNQTLLSIQSTTKHFVIRNCTFGRGALGLFIGGVKEGTARVENNVFNSQNYCVKDTDGDDSWCYRGDGVLVQSDGVTICNNTFQGSLIENEFYYRAIAIKSVKDCIIEENSIIISMEAIHIEFSKNITVNNNYISPTGAGIHVFFSDVITLENNLILEGSFYYALYFLGSTNIWITNTTITARGFFGISIIGCNYTQIYHNLVNNSVIDQGIRVGGESQFTTIHTNEIWNCSEYGIYISEYVSDTTIYHNSFKYNGAELFHNAQCLDDGINNTWYSSLLTKEIIGRI